MKNTKTHNLILAALFAALIVVGAMIRLPGPIVPFTMQFLATNLAGLLLGSRYGTASVAAYVAVGLMGVPVFAGGGGIGYILRPTFGYLVGFIVGAFVAGKIMENSEKKGAKAILLASFANLVIVYTMGIVYTYFLSNYYLGTPVTAKSLFIYSFLIVIPGDIISCLVSIPLTKRLKPLVDKNATKA